MVLYNNKNLYKGMFDIIKCVKVQFIVTKIAKKLNSSNSFGVLCSMVFLNVFFYRNETFVMEV